MGGVIPEDVKTAAYALVDKMKADDPGFDYSPYEFAIAAMWAERQRYTDLAEKRRFRWSAIMSGEK